MGITRIIKRLDNQGEGKFSGREERTQDNCAPRPPFRLKR